MPRRPRSRSSARFPPAVWKPKREAVAPMPCQESRIINVEQDVSLPPALSTGTAPQQPVAQCDKQPVAQYYEQPVAQGHEQPLAQGHRAREIAGMIFSFTCTLVVCLWSQLQHTHPFARLKTSLENKRLKAALENRFLLLLVVLLVGVYSGTLLAPWKMQAQAATELSQEDHKGAFKMPLEDNMVNSDWALKSLGATVDVLRTSQTYCCKWSWFCNVQNGECTEDGPNTILQMHCIFLEFLTALSLCVHLAGSCSARSCGVRGRWIGTGCILLCLACPCSSSRVLSDQVAGNSLCGQSLQ